MKTQRISFVLILCFLLTLSVCNSTSASTKEQIIFQKTEITDLATLWDMASRGISDNASVNMEAHSKLLDAPQGFVIENKSTTQKLKEVKRPDGIIAKSYATTIFETVIDTNNVPITTRSSRQWDENDGSESYRHVSTIYYDAITLDNKTWVKPQSINSKWYDLGDAQNYLKDARTGIDWWGYNGSYLSSGSEYYTGLDQFNISFGTTYSKSVSTAQLGGNGYIRCDAWGEHVMFEQRSVIKRVNGSEWTFQTLQVWALQ